MASRFPYIYGSMYNAGSPITVTFLDQTDYFLIGGTWTAGALRGITFTNNYGLTLSMTGYYLVTYFISISHGGTVGQNYVLQIYKDAVPINQTWQQQRVPAGPVVFSCGGSSSFYALAGQEITLHLRNGNTYTTGDVKYCQVNLVRVE